MTPRDRIGSHIRRPRLVLFALIMLCSASSWADPKAKTRVVLFSASEAAQLRVGDADWKAPPRRRSASNGPRIEVRVPEIKASGDGPIIETATPANLAVTFQANGTAVDMDSLEVTARKGFFSKSLTGLLKPYVRGTALDVKNVDIPSGNFLIEIAIADRAGVKTVETYRLRVDE